MLVYMFDKLTAVVKLMKTAMGCCLEDIIEVVPFNAHSSVRALRNAIVCASNYLPFRIFYRKTMHAITQNCAKNWDMCLDNIMDFILQIATHIPVCVILSFLF